MDQTAPPLRNVVAIPIPHEHAFTMRRLTWSTLAITAVMGACTSSWAFRRRSTRTTRRCTSTRSGSASRPCRLPRDRGVQLEAYEPSLDFPVRYRASSPSCSERWAGSSTSTRRVPSLPDVGILFFIMAFVLALDVGGALLVELIVLPRKKAGVYDSRSH